MSCYVVVKLVWVIVALFRPAPEGFGTTGWLLLNGVTLVMAGTGIALGLALAQPWGRRLPAVPVVLFSWVGAGFLVPMLPYLALQTALAALGVGTGGGDDGADAAPGWESALISIGFAGMALGLAVGLPVYFRERWPGAFLGRLAEAPAAASPLVTSPLVTAVAVVAVVGAVGLGALWCYWGLGGTLGLDPARRAAWDLNGRLLNTSAGLWALLGAVSVAALIRGRPARIRRWVPLVLAFGASGALFAWSGWKLPMVILGPGGFVTAEYPMLAVAEHSLAIGVGLALLAAVVRGVRPAEAEGYRLRESD